MANYDLFLSVSIFILFFVLLTSFNVNCDILRQRLVNVCDSIEHRVIVGPLTWRHGVSQGMHCMRMLMADI